MNCFYLVNRKHINTSYSYIRKKYFFLTASHCGKAFFYYLHLCHLLSLICGFSRKRYSSVQLGKMLLKYIYFPQRKICTPTSFT